MFHHKWIARSILIAGLVIGYAHESSADTFTAETLLTWKTDSQNFYIMASINMTSVIVTQTDNAKAHCINDWHEKQDASDYHALRRLMSQYPSYHPQGILLAAIQKACGDVGN